MHILLEKNHEFGKCYTFCGYILAHNRSSRCYSFAMAFVKSLMRVINHKLPPHKHQFCLPKKYRSHLCRHYLTLTSSYMDMVDYGCLDLIQFEKDIHEKAPHTFHHKQGKRCSWGCSGRLSIQTYINNISSNSKCDNIGTSLALEY